jgi:hypothetical protein
MSHRNLVLLLTLVVLSFAIGMQAEDRANCSNYTARQLRSACKREQPHRGISLR